LINSIKEEIKSLGFKVTDENISDYIEHGGIYESYFVENERIYTYVFIGRR
jgi:hypothetical protein